MTIAVSYHDTVHHARITYASEEGPFTLPDGRLCPRLWEAISLLRDALVAPLPCRLGDVSRAMDERTHATAPFPLPDRVVALLRLRQHRKKVITMTADSTSAVRIISAL